LDAKLVIIAEGRDAHAAVNELAALFQRKFDEE
jgi:phosphotransferase system HPr-like phosphotransfer protein